MISGSVASLGIRVSSIVLVAVPLGCGQQSAVPNSPKEVSGETPGVEVTVDPSNEQIVQEAERKPYTLSGCEETMKQTFSETRTIRDEAKIETGLALDVKGF